MAIRAKYTKQMPWVGSNDQADIIDAYADELGISKAEVVRRAFDVVFGLAGGVLPEGLSVTASAELGRERLESGWPSRDAVTA